MISTDALAFSDDSDDLETQPARVSSAEPSLTSAKPSCNTQVLSPATLLRDAAGNLTSSIGLPVVKGVVAWRILGIADFGPHRYEWAESMDAAELAELVLPRAIFVDPLQSEWMTALHVLLVAEDETGHVLGDWALEPISVVWPNGAAGEPRLLDTAGLALEAPVGAWSAAARATVASIELEAAGGSTMQVAPPVGGDE